MVFMKSIEQLTLWKTTNPFEVEAEWMNKHPQPEKVQAKKERKRVARDSTYADFYDEGVKLNGNIGLQTAEKRRLLIRYFSHRFGDKENQPIRNKTDYQVGGIFNNMLDYSEKRFHP